MADRDLGKARFCRQPCQRHFVGRIKMAMHQHDRDRAHPANMGRAEGGKRGFLIERGDDRAIIGDTLGNFQHVAIQRRGAMDLQCEDIGPVLRPDQQRIAEAACDRQQHLAAPTFKQRVGGDRSADADVRRRQRPGLAAGQPTHRLDCGIVIAARIDRQQLGGDDLAIRAARDDIGKRTAAIDPKAPAVGRWDRGGDTHPPLIPRRPRRGKGGHTRTANQSPPVPISRSLRSEPPSPRSEPPS